MQASGDEIRRQLDRLLASRGFANAGRMSRFLKFIVERTLAGEGERLKEYVIGVEVFDRDTDYDPRIDAIVRVEAARLRTKLAEYYADEGRGDAIVLSLPKGGYAPTIRLERAPAVPSGSARAATDGSATITAAKTGPPRRPSRDWLGAGALGVTVTAALAIWAVWAPGSRVAPPAVRIAVLPFEPYPDSAGVAAEAAAMRLTEGVTAELVRDGRFAVIASSAARAAAAADGRPRDVAAALAADVLIEARLTLEEERVLVEARAASAREQKLWVQDFAGTAADADALTREIASAIAAALAALNAGARR